jgi:sulfoquinovosidase
MIPRHLRFSVLLSLALVACGGSPESVDPAPVEHTYGAFRVRVDDGDRLTVAVGDRELLAGLAPSDAVGQGFASNEADPPMTGFATREVSTDREMLFGSFKIVDHPRGDWARDDAVAFDADGASAVVSRRGEVLAQLSWTNGDDDDPQHLVVDIEPGPGAARRFSWAFSCDAADHFLGFGTQTWGVDARGESVPIWVEEEGIHKDLTTDDPIGAWYAEGRRHSAYMPVPEYLSSRGYFAVVESGAREVFAMCSERADVVRLQLELPARLHLFDGPTLPAALARKTGQFGRARVPPDFAFAPWNDAIMGSARVRAVAAELRAAHVPSSVIWTEDWRGGEANPAIPGGYSLKEEWEVDRTLYPDFEDVASELHAAGFKWLVYFNSFVEKDSKAWPETATQGRLIAKGVAPYVFSDAKFRDASMVDLSKNDAVKWAVAKMKAAIAIGADGWMGDYSEWLPTDATLAAGSGLELHQRYPVEWQEAQRAALDGIGDGVERLSFVRSGGVGTPGLADVFWAGDQSTDFAVDDGMPTVLPIGIGAGLAGVSTFGSDIGGYSTVGTKPTTKEVFFRWTELGAWSPVMRTHHTTAPSLSWSFDRDAETLAHWARYARLHVALAPYFMGLARVAHATGLAIWRPVAFADPADASLWSIADEVLVGDGVLVAPVQKAGATGREVKLPSGVWYPWLGVAKVDGGAAMSVSAGRDEIPVFARAGAIVPTFPDGVETLVREPSSAERASDDRVLLVFTGADGTFVEADGRSYTLHSSSAPASGAVTAKLDGASVAVTSPGGADRVTFQGGGALELSRGGQLFATIVVARAPASASFTIVSRR